MRHPCGDVLLVAGVAALAACALVEPDPHATLERVIELEERARAIARTDGCDRVDQCATAPVGARACGGPRTYLVYCRATTNEAELFWVLHQLKRTEEAYNESSAGGPSPCDVVGPPSVQLEARSCVRATR